MEQKSSYPDRIVSEEKYTNEESLPRFVFVEYLEPLDQRSSLTPLRLRIGSFTNTSRWNGIVAGMSPFR